MAKIVRWYGRDSVIPARSGEISSERGATARLAARRYPGEPGLRGLGHPAALRSFWRDGAVSDSGGLVSILSSVILTVVLNLLLLF
ncbi:MAG TPA: hypothetical protein VHF46_02370 [Rubrobacteraceae bacterium]|nr:hypothetical protein [Rubrobacteraceae bacterium]